MMDRGFTDSEVLSRLISLYVYIAIHM